MATNTRTAVFYLREFPAGSRRDDIAQAVYLQFSPAHSVQSIPVGFVKSCWNLRIPKSLLRLSPLVLLAVLSARFGTMFSTPPLSTFIIFLLRKMLSFCPLTCVFMVRFLMFGLNIGWVFPM